MTGGRTSRLGSFAMEVKMLRWSGCRSIVLGALACALLLPAGAWAQQAKEHEFHGKVEKVDSAAKSVTVDGETVQGWMGAMTMAYHVDKPEVLATLKPGDYITATVKDGDFMMLYGVKVDASRVADDLPPLSYVCNSKGEEAVIEAEPGKCPKSGEPLMPVRLVTAYSCLKVQIVVRDKPGICPIDHTKLVPITAALYFTCATDKSVKELTPGKCADGNPRIKMFERRPHGDHNPRHGGLFFMAADQWHHIEGTFVQPNVFRVFFYDDMTRPLEPTGFAGRVATADANATATGAPIPLANASNAPGNTLEAKITPGAPPLNLKLYMKFGPDDKEQVFDFQFPAYSKEP
jgi:Cu/Ag efflux protein CusF